MFLWTGRDHQQKNNMVLDWTIIGWSTPLLHPFQAAIRLSNTPPPLPRPEDALNFSSESQSVGGRPTDQHTLWNNQVAS